MAYEKFDPDKSDVRAVAIKFNGNLTAMAKELKVSRETMYQYLKRDPNGKEIIEHIRGFNTFTDADLAEHVVRFNMMSFEKRPGIAQRSAEFFLIHKAKDRGWVKDEKDPQQDSQLIDKAMELLDHLQSESDTNSALNIADSNINNADKS